LPPTRFCQKNRFHSDRLLARLDYPAYFEMLEQPVISTRAGILDRLKKDGMILGGENDRWDVTNLGAILFARKLTDFETLRRKAIRVVVYKGTNRTETLKEQPGLRGYAVSGGGRRGHNGGVVRARPRMAGGGEWRGCRPERWQRSEAFVMSFLRHGQIYQSDLLFHLTNSVGA